MSDFKSHPSDSSRREFLTHTSATVFASGALAGVAVPRVHAAAGEDAVRLALIGSGNRGSGAVGTVT